MKAYRVIFFALLFVLGACSQAPTPTATPEETLTSQAVLQGASGLVYYVVHNPNAVNPYSVVSHDQAANTKKTLYKTKREIQSVAGTLTGSTVIISMRETEDPASDFEIFDITNNIATQWTTNSFDDTHVSITRGGTSLGFPTYKMVWETQVSCDFLCTKRGIQIRSAFNGFTDSFVSAGSGDLTQPTISGNGRFIVFVRVSGNSRSVQRYTVSTGIFNVLVSNNGGIGSPSYSAPSVSDDGIKIAYLSRRVLGLTVSYSVRLFDFNFGTDSSIVSGATFSHPHLTADGKWLTYTQQVNGSSRIKTRNLVTNLETSLTAPVLPVNHVAPFWQKANP
jgi:hypothetical protein